MKTSLAGMVDSIRGKASGSRTQIGNVLVAMLVTVLVAGTVMVFTRGNSEKEILRIAIKQGVEGVALKDIASHFNDKGRADAGHIQVEVVEFPYDQLYELEQEQLDGRDYPPTQRFDVIMVDDPWLYSLVLDPNDKDKPRLEKLNAVVKDETDYFPSTLRVCQYCPDGPERCPKDYYAVPFVANSQLFAHRGTDLLGSEPTWKQVLDVSEGVERTGRLGYIMRIGPGNSIVTDFMPILWAYDPKSFPEYPKGDVLNQPNDAFVTLINLVGSRKSLGSAGMDDFDVSAYLQVSDRQGGASMGIVWSAWAMMLAKIEDDMAKEAGAENGLHFAAPKRNAEPAPLTFPRYPAEKTDERKPIQSGVSWKDKEQLQFGKVPRLTSDAVAPPELGAWLLAVPINAEHKDAARAFIRFATEFATVELAKHEPPNQSAPWRANPTPRKSVLEELAKEKPFTTHPSLKGAIQWSLENARPRPRTACWKEIESRLGKNLEKLLAQNPAPTETLLQTTILQIRNDLRELIDAKDCRSFLQEQARRKKKPLDSEVRQ